MPAFARVIVEVQNGQWRAYFGDEPHTAVSGVQPYHALRSLLHTMGKGQFQESRIQLLDEATREDHFEFLAAFRVDSFSEPA
jgi:hypothetical protein